MITDKQREARMKSLGSSDAPVILGVDPFRTPYDLWLQKTSRVPQTKENDAMRLGSVLEIPLLQLAGERIGARVVRPSSAFVGCYPYLKANIDGMVGEAKRGSDIVEVKTTSSTEGWGTEGTDQVPDRVRVQVAFQMSCASANLAHIACLTGAFGLQFKMYRIPYDADFCGYVMERCDAWWRKHIEGGEPPPERGTLDLLKQGRRTDEAVNLDPALFEEERRLASALADAEKAHEAAKARLVTALGSARRGFGGQHSISVIEVETDRFDRKAFEAEHADLARQYVVPSSYSRIDIRTKKEKP